MERRDEAKQFYANPDGTTTVEIAAAPERVRQHNGSWADVDLTLVERDDGSVGPRVSAGDVSFSRGGAGPVVTVGTAGESLSVTMPMPLPQPILEGPSATYVGVYPGVDLRMTAVGTSFRQELVVHNRKAAANPALRSIELTTATKGGTLEVVDDALVLRDGHGKVVMQGQSASMWDASDRRPSPAVGDVVPESESLSVEPIQVEARRNGGSATLTLRPSGDMLSDPDTKYPVVIDPDIDRTAFSWAMVNKTFPDQEYYKWSDQDQGVGYNSYEGTHGKRLYWSFSIPSELKRDGVVMSKAYLSAWSTFSATCAPGSVRLYRTRNFDSTTNWNNRPATVGAELSRFSGKAGTGCQSSGSGLRAEMSVGVGLRESIDAGYERLHLGMISANETSNDGWFRFAGPGNTTSWKRPKLIVTYNTKPSTPGWGGDYTIDGTTCYTSMKSTRYLNPDGQMSATAFAGDVDPNDQVRAEAEWWDAYPRQKVRSAYDPSSTGFMVRNQVASATIPTTLTEGTHFVRWRIRDKDGAVSGWSPECPFAVDKTAPTTPKVTIVGHADGDVVPVGSTQRFTIASSSDVREVGYQWRINGVAEPTKLAATDGSPLELTRRVDGSRVELRAFARDRAENRSNTSDWVAVHGALNGITAQYGMVAGTDPVPGDATKRTVPDGVAGAPILWDGQSVADKFTFPLTVSEGATKQVVRPARGNVTTDTTSVISLDGTIATRAVADDSPVLAHAAQQPQTQTNGSVVPTYSSSVPGFTASAWVQLSSTSSSKTLLAQLAERGAVSSNVPLSFDVGYDGPSGKFVGRVFDAAGTEYSVTDAAPTSSVRTSGWWHVALSYRAGVPASGTTPAEPARLELLTMRESSDGLLESDQVRSVASAAPESIRPTNGPLVVSHSSAGRARWIGSIDDVRTWQGMATPSQVYFAAKASS